VTGCRYACTLRADVGKAGSAEAVEEELLGRDKEAVEGTGSGPGADVLVEHATVLVIRSVDSNDDVVDRELLCRPCEAVATARPCLRSEQAGANEERE
jgi:hypothetical protein